jgi:DNA-binding transcriptional ArsR family regulator
MAATISDEFLNLMSEKFRMLSDSTRLAILRTLMQGERNVTGVNSRSSRARDQIQAALGAWMNTHSSAHQIPVPMADDSALARVYVTQR